jgi:hypothetical protein
MVKIEGKKDAVQLTLTRVEAAALLHAADVGLRVIDALALAQRTASTEARVDISPLGIIAARNRAPRYQYGIGRKRA